VARLEIEHRNQSEISCEIKKNPTECFQLLKEVYGDKVMSKGKNCSWKMMHIRDAFQHQEPKKMLRKPVKLFEKINV
jgi:hypothetical protein